MSKHTSTPLSVRIARLRYRFWLAAYRRSVRLCERAVRRSAR